MDGIIDGIMDGYMGSGWWLSHPSEKWWTSSVGIMTFPIYGK
jgi:hypothetical protein